MQNRSGESETSRLHVVDFIEEDYEETATEEEEEEGEEEEGRKGRTGKKTWRKAGP